jgi:hypothetical protein
MGNIPMPAHLEVQNIAFSRFNGSITKEGLIDNTKPYEIECKAQFLPSFWWHFRIVMSNINGVPAHFVQIAPIFLGSKFYANEMFMNDKSATISYRDID